MNEYPVGGSKDRIWPAVLLIPLLVCTWQDEILLVPLPSGSTLGAARRNVVISRQTSASFDSFPSCFVRADGCPRSFMR